MAINRPLMQNFWTVPWSGFWCVLELTVNERIFSATKWVQLDSVKNALRVSKCNILNVLRLKTRNPFQALVTNLCNRMSLFRVEPIPRRANSALSQFTCLTKDEAGYLWNLRKKPGFFPDLNVTRTIAWWIKESTRSSGLSWFVWTIFVYLKAPFTLILPVNHKKWSTQPGQKIYLNLRFLRWATDSCGYYSVVTLTVYYSLCNLPNS